MKKKRVLLFALAAISLVTSCSSPPGPHTKTSAGAGALIGAGAGALVGNPFVGFIAGGAIGAATGHEKERRASSTPSWNDNVYETYPSSAGNHTDDFTAWEPLGHHDDHSWKPADLEQGSGMLREEQPTSGSTTPGGISQAYPQPDSSPFYVSPDTFYR